jgi:predicted PurR-regulated permease PerM
MIERAEPSTRRLAPDWLVNLAALGWRVLVTAILAIVLLAIAWQLATVTASVLVAVIIAATFAPFALALRDRGWSRTAAAGVVTIGAVVVLGATVVLILLAFAPYVGDIQQAIEDGLAALRAELDGLDVAPEVAAAIEDVAAGLQEWIAGAAGAVVGAIATAVTVAILAGFLLFFLLQDGDKAWVWALQSARAWQRDRVTSAGHDALERVGGYLRGTAILAASDAVTDFVFLTLLGVPLAAPLSVLVFLGGFIPYIGGLIATTVLVLVTLATNGATDVVILLVLITITNIIQGNILAPIIYGRTVNIHPAIVIVALPAGAAVAGMVGLFVAIPVVALIMAVTGALVAALDLPPGEERVNDDVPVWLDRLAQWSWRLLVAIAVAVLGILIAVQVPSVVLPIIIAGVLAATLAPLADALVRRGRRRSVAAAAATGGGFLVVIAIVVITVVSLASGMRDIVDAASTGSGSIEDAAGSVLGGLRTVVEVFGAGAITAVAQVVADLAGLAVALFLGGFLAFYFLKDGAAGWRAGTRRLSDRRRAQVDAAGARAVGVLGGYMIGTGAISAFGAITQLVIMVILGLPLALPLAVLSFFGGFIPYIGSFITTGLAFLVTVAVGEPSDILVMAIFTIVFNIVQGNFVAPLVYGRVASIHPAVVLLAIPAGSQIAGVLGMFLAVPVIGIVAVTWRTVLRVFDPKADTLAPATSVPDPESTPETEPSPVSPADEPRLGDGPPPDHQRP